MPREIFLLCNEVDEHHVTQLKDVPIVSVTTKVWMAESNEAFCSFTVSQINKDWEVYLSTVACTLLNCQHTDKKLVDMSTKTMRTFKLDGKIPVITTDEASTATWQVKLRNQDENILIDIYEDHGEEAGDRDLIDKILCQLEFEDDLLD